MKMISAIKFFHILIIVTIFLSCEKSAVINEAVTLRLWPMLEDSMTSTEKPLPSRGDGVLRITDISNPSLTIYPVGEAENPTPAVLIFPGGAYAYIAINKEGIDVAKWFNSIGVTAVLVKYTVPDNKEAAFKDGQRALRLVRHYAKEWNIDPQRVGVIGFSAGGHLAARLSTDFERELYTKIDSADTESCRPDFSILMYPAYLENKETHSLADQIKISAEIPPTFIVQTKDDSSLVGGAILYDQALKDAGISSVFHLFPEGGHGYGIWPSEYEVSNWPELCEKWLKEIGIIHKDNQ
ncbi:MAG: alpha/beta hydrolase [Calditrichaceae bacterium]|nr:alpha/beta hydrolase [Calditrichaceae bacterium]